LRCDPPTFLPVLPTDAVLPISFSRVARITGVSHLYDTQLQLGF
jgi:hypothetical protein